MQDAPYRMRTVMNAMGYFQVPTLSYVPEAVSPNLNLTVQKEGKASFCRVVAVAPLARGLKGTVALSAPKGVKLDKAAWTVEVPPGGRVAERVGFTGGPDGRGEPIRAVLTLEDGTVLNGAVPLGL